MWSHYFIFYEFIDLCKVHDSHNNTQQAMRRIPEQWMQRNSIQYLYWCRCFRCMSRFDSALIQRQASYDAYHRIELAFCKAPRELTVLACRMMTTLHHCVFRWSNGDGHICIQRVRVSGRHATCQTYDGSHSDHVSCADRRATRCGAKYRQL